MEPLGTSLNLRLQGPTLQNMGMVLDCCFSAEIFDTLVWADLRSDRIIVSWLEIVQYPQFIENVGLSHAPHVYIVGGKG